MKLAYIVNCHVMLQTHFWKMGSFIRLPPTYCRYFANQDSNRDHAKLTASWWCSPKPSALFRSIPSGELFMKPWPTFGYMYTSEGIFAFFSFSSKAFAVWNSSKNHILPNSQDRKTCVIEKFLSTKEVLPSIYFVYLHQLSSNHDLIIGKEVKLGLFLIHNLPGSATGKLGGRISQTLPIPWHLTAVRSYRISKACWLGL